MSWQIAIPYEDRGDLVLDAITAAKQEFGEDDHRTRLVEVLAADALHSRGITSVGGLLDELGGLDQAGVRARLDWARARLGLPTTGEVSQRRADARFEGAFQRLQPPDPEPWSPLQRCPSCGRYPMKGNGAWGKVDCRQWWCPEHREGHQDDMKPHEPAVVGLSPSGAPIFSQKEKKRRAEWIKARDEAQRQQRERREEVVRREGETIEAAKQHFADTGEISVMGIRTKPDLRIIER